MMPLDPRVGISVIPTESAESAERDPFRINMIFMKAFSPPPSRVLGTGSRNDDARVEELDLKRDYSCTTYEDRKTTV